MTDARSAIPRAIPRAMPTREEVAELAEREPHVLYALELYRRGHVHYEDALRIALLSVADAKERAFAEIAKARGDAADVVYLYPPRIPDAARGPGHDLLARVAAAAFAVGAGVGVGLACLFG